MVRKSFAPFQNPDEKEGEEPGLAAKSHNAVFPDAANMKKRLREIHKPRYDVKNFYWETGFCQAIARHPLFESLTLCVIGFNALWISIDSDLNEAAVLSDAEPQFIIAENFFCVYFTFEWSMRFGAFREKRNCLRDKWFLFDSFMVCMMILETWVFTLVFGVLGSGEGEGGGVGNASMLRLLRLLRLTRMLRMARLLRSMPELMILIKGIAAAIRSVIFTLFLLLVLIYVFGIMFKQVAVGTEMGSEYFSTVPDAMHSLLLDGVFLDNIGNLVDMTVDTSTTEQAALLLFMFYIFVLLASLTMMNMLIGVVCEVVSVIADYEREELTMMFMRDEFENFVQDYRSPDLEEDVRITKDDFVKILEAPGAAALLRDVDVDIESLVDLIETIFTAEDGKQKVLNFGDLIEVMLNYRASKKASYSDITHLRKYTAARLDRGEIRNLSMMFHLESTISSLSDVIESIAEVEKGTIAQMARAELALEIEAEKKDEPAKAPQADDISSSNGKSNEVQPSIVGRPYQ